MLISDANERGSVAFAYNAAGRPERNLIKLSLLTNYRPNFCSECGEKIVRLRWRFWTSRRFCDKCSARFTRSQLLRVTSAAIAFLVVGVLIGRGTRQKPLPLVIERPVNTPAAQNASTPPATVTVNDVYICGARTKKGTPCSRRVHGPVRCWQHKGLPAMLPVEKLRVKG